MALLKAGHEVRRYQIVGHIGDEVPPTVVVPDADVLEAGRGHAGVAWDVEVVGDTTEGAGLLAGCGGGGGRRRGGGLYRGGGCGRCRRGRGRGGGGGGGRGRGNARAGSVSVTLGAALILGGEVGAATGDVGEDATIVSVRESALASLADGVGAELIGAEGVANIHLAASRGAGAGGAAICVGRAQRVGIGELAKVGGVAEGVLGGVVLANAGSDGAGHAIVTINIGRAGLNDDGPERGLVVLAFEGDELGEGSRRGGLAEPEQGHEVPLAGKV